MATHFMFGPRIDAAGVTFQLWAPGAHSVELILEPDAPGHRRLELQPVGDGFWQRSVTEAGPATRYLFARDGGPPLPDPASRFQPTGVHGPSEVIASEQTPDAAGWSGRRAEELVVYELHVGTFTPEGTYQGVVRHLDHLAALGVTAIELLPLAAFAGGYNWGYDGVFHFAPFAGYGRPQQLQRLVAECHRRQIAVILDLVTNHFGPEGNAMWTLAPEFFRPDRPTAWSAGHDWDAEPVMRYFDELALYWVEAYRLDGLRFDAFHAIPLRVRHRHLQRMIGALERWLPADRRLFLLLESIDNQTSLLGCGTERITVAQLNFDFQRATHALVTGERHREYSAFDRPAEELERCLDRGFAYRGRFNRHLGRVCGEHQTPASWDSLVNFVQNHDTVGNRYQGQRLDQLVEPEPLRAVTALLLLHPAIPFLFMGQEWGASSPYFFFTDFPEPLGQQVQQGRRRLFAELDGKPTPAPAPECQDPAAFSRSILRWSQLAEPEHGAFLAFVKQLLALRQELTSQSSRQVDALAVERREDALFTIGIGARGDGGECCWLVANLTPEDKGLSDLGTLLFATRPSPPGVIVGWSTALFRQGGRRSPCE